MFSIVVAGNAIARGPQVALVQSDVGKGTLKVMLPDWNAGEWRWWIDLCLDMADAMESAKPEDAKPDIELEKLRALATAARMEVQLDRGAESEAGPLSGDDGVGWLAWAGKLLMAGGRLLKSQGKRIAKWGVTNAKAAAGKVWSVAKAAFSKAPKTIIAATALLIIPDKAKKVVKVASDMASDLLGAALKGLTSNPAVLIAIAVGLYFAFGGKSATD
jgi:hypothetical protein